MSRRGTRKCSKCKRNRQVKFFTSPRGRVCSDCKRAGTRRVGRRQHLEETYGITLEEYEALLAAQGGVCAICKGKRNYNLHVDHDHALEKVATTRESVRGLLCKTCNGRLLPGAKDNIDTLNNAIYYLTWPPARGIIDTDASRNGE